MHTHKNQEETEIRNKIRAKVTHMIGGEKRKQKYTRCGEEQKREVTKI